MARHRRMLAPINTNKHYVHTSKTSFAAGSKLAIGIIESVVAPAAAQAFQVRQGAVVKAVHLEYWVSVDASIGDIGQQIAVLEKVPAGAVSVTFAQLSNLGSYINKKNILWTFQGLVNDSNGSSAIPIIRDWILIPKGKQRMGLGDELVFTIGSVITTGVLCGLSTYKEFT